MRLTMATTSEGSVTLAGNDERNSSLCEHVFLLRLRLHCQSPGTRGATGWMRLFSQRRLYQCSSCRKLQLLPEEAVNRAKAEYASREAMPNQRPRSAAA